MCRPAYRARTEWNGIELFERNEGRSFLIEPDGALDAYDCEKPIDTPYHKNANYCSAPKRVYWELTRKCNLACANCYNRFAAPHFAGEMDLEQCMRLGKTLYENGVWIVQLTGGEPTASPHVWELAAYLKALGFYLAMGTNGVWKREVMDNALASGIDWLIVSVDDEHLAQSKPLLKDGVLAAIETAGEYARAGRRVRVNTLIQEGNHTYEQLKPLAENCCRIGVESLNCIPLRPFTSEPSALKKQLTKDGFRAFIAALEILRAEYPDLNFVTTLDLKPTDSHDRVYKKEKSCAAGREGCVISPYGDVYGCSYSLASSLDGNDPERARFVAGNLDECGFMDIWNDSKRWAVYRDLQMYKHERCRRCDYYNANRCIGNCPIMVKNSPGAFDPYCYVDVGYQF
ncbi:MAG: radical SAM protein [Clostridiales Family XIII bacterium]|jgi:radical SAM protein with 4Fe4S-binding SPASM domain|nr:radical SAM protein [Clostridiales Family XIII bacterium]